MACHTCEYINAEIMRKAKAAADALLSVVKLNPAWPYDAAASVDTRLHPGLGDDTTASRETTGQESSSDTPTAAV
jgi:hypothetical protein